MKCTWGCIKAEEEHEFEKVAGWKEENVLWAEATVPYSTVFVVLVFIILEEMCLAASTESREGGGGGGGGRHLRATERPKTAAFLIISL